MSNGHRSEQHHLRPLQDAADPADRSNATTPSPASSPFRHRATSPTYERLLKQADSDDVAVGGTTAAGTTPHHGDNNRFGLGIDDTHDRISEQTTSLPRHKSAASTASTLKYGLFPATQTAPDAHNGFGENTTYEGAGATVDRDGLDRSGSRRTVRSTASRCSSQSPYVAESDTKTLRRTPASLYESSPHPHGFSPIHACPTRKNFYRGRNSWFTWTIIILSLYSTAFSAMFLIIALRAPRWPMIHDRGSLTPANASLLTAIFAKTIEMSFATAFVAFLGQVLSRRSMAVASGGKGVTLAELSMRNWVFQPGVMITRWETVRYAGMTILGVTSCVAAVSAMLYTSASDALVQPQLKYGKWEHKELAGNVFTSFANATYLGHHCQTPVSLDQDPEYHDSTCIDIYYNAKSSHDFQTYLANWAGLSDNSTGAIRKGDRAIANSLAASDTLVNGTWMNVTMEEQDGRIVNRALLAMPHSGVLAAATDDRNKILQPDQLGGLGAYTLVASTPSPVVDVVCANMNRSELAPIVWSAWNNPDELDTSSFTSQLGWYGPDNWLNKTVVDDIFGWGENVTNGEHPPVFAKYPLQYNTILNQTAQSVARPSVYILGRDGDTSTERYSLCQIKAMMTPNCSTTYVAAEEGSSLYTTCNPEVDNMAYINHWKDATNDELMRPSDDWLWIGSELANSMSLNTGIVDGKAANCRMLTEMITKEPELSPTMPSMAEAMAVIMGNSLLMSTKDAPFVGFWNHTGTLAIPETQYFNSTLRAREYASGANGSPQKAFFLVLAVVFLFNTLCLAYFLYHCGLVTDFSEPPNLFSLAVNSPPSAHLAGSCGVGPQGRQYGVEWCINEVGEHLFLHPREAVDAAVDVGGVGRGPGDGTSGWRKHLSVGGGGAARAEQRTFSNGIELGKASSDSPVSETFASLRTRRSFL